MNTNEVICKLKTDNRLKVGFHTESTGLLVLDSFQQVVAGEPLKFHYKDPETGGKKMLMIEGSKTFNLDNPIEQHNWDMLKLDLKLHPELEEQLTLIEPGKIASDKLAAAKRKKELLDILLEHESDGEWLAKVHRRVIGGATGITTPVLLQALLDKADTDLNAFTKTRRGDTDWVFEGEYFETEALLDFACERGILIKDGEFYKKADGAVFANDRAKAVYALKNDAGFRHYVQSSLSVPVSDPALDPTPMIEDLETVDLIKRVGERAPQTVTRPDGSVDEQAEADKDQVALETLVDTLVRGGFINTEAGSYVLTDQNQTFATIGEVVGYFKSNGQVRQEYEELTKV